MDANSESEIRHRQVVSLYTKHYWQICLSSNFCDVLIRLWFFFRKVEDRKTQFSIDDKTDSSRFTNISEDLVVIMLNSWFCYLTELFIKIFWSKK